MNTQKAYTVVNEDFTDDKEPHLFIQRYNYPKRTYQVIRKAYDEKNEGKFIPNPIYKTKYWSVNCTLIMEYEFDPDLPTEVFAIVYRDEENPPMDNQDTTNAVDDPCLLITYDHEKKTYLCESTSVYGEDIEDYNEQDEEAFNEVEEKTLRTAIDKSIAILDQLIENSLKEKGS